MTRLTILSYRLEKANDSEDIVMNEEFPIAFEAIICYDEFSQFITSVVYLPKKFHKELPLKQNPRLRVRGTIDAIAFELALHPTGSKRWYLLLSKKLQKKLGKDVGDHVTVMFEIDDQDRVTVPEELRRALNADVKALERWEALRPGKKRSWAYRIASAKKEETRLRRILEVLEDLVDA